MNLLGIHLTLLIGSTVAVPAPALLVEAFQSVQVTHADEGHSGFQITFRVGRSGPFDLVDYPLLSNPLLSAYNRVILIVTFNATPRVLMDGVITNKQLAPSNEPGASTLSITGEDVSVMMDLKDKTDEHVSQNAAARVRKIISSYPEYYGLSPKVIEAPDNPPNPNQNTPVQDATDLKYIQRLARFFGYVFYTTPGPVSGTNSAYWGPSERLGVSQPPLSANLGPETNVENLNFRSNALGPTAVFGRIQDSETNASLPVQTLFSTRPPLSTLPGLALSQRNRRQQRLGCTGGLNYVQAQARAQAITDRSTDDAVTVAGELDPLRYGDLLKPYNLVDLRGVGYTYNGSYRVKSVTHTIRRGEYKQSFTLTRDGEGSTRLRV